MPPTPIKYLSIVFLHLRRPGSMRKHTTCNLQVSKLGSTRHTYKFFDAIHQIHASNTDIPLLNDIILIQHRHNNHTPLRLLQKYQSHIAAIHSEIPDRCQCSHAFWFDFTSSCNWHLRFFGFATSSVCLQPTIPWDIDPHTVSRQPFKDHHVVHVEFLQGTTIPLRNQYPFTNFFKHESYNCLHLAFCSHLINNFWL